MRALYDKVKSKVTHTATRVSGFGAESKRITIGLAKVDGLWWEVWEGGCHKACSNGPEDYTYRDVKRHI